MNFTMTSDSRSIQFGTKHRHTVALNRMATRREVSAALNGVRGVSPINPASIACGEVKSALKAAGLR